MSVYQERGRLVFEFSRYIGGKRKRIRKLLPKGWTRAQADAYDRKESAALYSLASGDAKPRFTIGQAVRRYLTERVPQLKSGENIKREIAWLQDWYNERAMEELPTVCAEYAADQHGALRPATIRNRIAYLRAACRWAWKRHGMGDSDPGARIQATPVSNNRQTYVDRRQMLEIAKHCKHKAARAMIRVAWYSGMRLGEIERCRPDWAAGVAILDDTKNGEPRHVPIHPRILVCLRRYQWPSRYTFGYWFRLSRDRAGLPHVHAHDLRHSAASELIRVGVDLSTIGAILGHKSAASIKRYAHHATAQKRDAINRMGRNLPVSISAKDAPKAAA